MDTFFAPKNLSKFSFLAGIHGVVGSYFFGRLQVLACKCFLLFALKDSPSFLYPSILYALQMFVLIRKKIFYEHDVN